MHKIDDIPDLDDSQFWNLVSVAKQDFATFEQELEQMSQVALIGFVWKFEERAGFLYNEKYLHNQTSGDYMEDLCGYVVGQGREFYEQVCGNPNQMPKEVNYSEPGIDIKYQASEVYEDRFGEPMPSL